MLRGLIAGIGMGRLGGGHGVCMDAGQAQRISRLREDMSPMWAGDGNR